MIRTRLATFSCVAVVASLFAASEASAARYHQRYRSERFFSNGRSVQREPGVRYFKDAGRPPMNTAPVPAPVAPVTIEFAPSTAPAPILPAAPAPAN